METIVIALVTLVTLGSLGAAAFALKKVFLPMIASSTALLDSVANGARDRQALLASGESAQARVLGLQETGTYINHHPQVEMELEIYPQGRPPFRAQARAIVSPIAIPRVQPGATVPVRFDPSNPARVAVLA